MTPEDLAKLREIHGLTDRGRCGVCRVEWFSDDDETQVWPCDTAELLFSPLESANMLAQHAEAKRANYMAKVTVGRDIYDRMRATDPEEFWVWVRLEQKNWEYMQVMKVAYAPLMLHALRGGIRFEKFAEKRH